MTMRKRLKKTIRYTPSLVSLKGEPIEMVYDKEAGETKFAILNKGKVKYLDEFCLDPRDAWSILPYPAQNSIIKSELVLFPSEAKKYRNEQELIKKIQSFIHHYLDVTPFFEKLSAYYVLFTWVYDGFNELPYLRAIGDFGSGKTRLLQTIGSICYKPIFANGATTVSPIFRLIDGFRGTLILDEADFHYSEAWSEIVKILNSGHSKGMPVVRSEGGDKKEFEPRAFNVFCPKIIATRGYFKDKALESRFIVEEMGHRKLRDDIPISLPNIFWDEALELRNYLLMFRLKNFGKKTIDESLVDRSLEPRLNQIIVPLASIIDNLDLREELKTSVAEYSQQMICDRGMEFEGQILEVINELKNSGTTEPLIKQIKDKLLEKYGDDFDKKPTDRGIGARIRKSFKLHTQRGRDGYFIPATEKEKLERLFERYGIVNDVKVVKVIEGLEKGSSEEISLQEIKF